MRWQTKARIARFLSTIPGGAVVYKGLQKLNGSLWPDPAAKIDLQVGLCRWILETGHSIEGSSLLEVGTGHVPVVPVGFYLAGARSVVTLDLNRRLDFALLRKLLVWLSENEDNVRHAYAGVVDPEILGRRLSTVRDYSDRPREFLRAAQIEYRAPADAAETGFADGSIDYHFSVNVLEHIPPRVLRDILGEASRVLTRDGIGIHVVDPSDHFEHSDKSISKINCLRFSDSEWRHIAGNQFTYCNRLRLRDYVSLFKDSGFEVARLSTVVDEDSLRALETDGSLARAVSCRDPNDVCCTNFTVALRT